MLRLVGSIVDNSSTSEIRYRIRFPFAVSFFAIIAWIVPMVVGAAFISEGVSDSEIWSVALGAVLLTAFFIVDFVLMIQLLPKQGLRDESVLSKSITQVISASNEAVGIEGK
jgi:hypothetical protein